MERAVVRLQKWTDNEVERQCCRHEVAAEDIAPVDESSSGSHLETIYIKSELPDAELEEVTVKEEPIDWNQEPQASSGPGFNAFTGPEACSGHAEAKDNLREDSCDAYNTTTVHQRPAGAPQGSADSLPSDVSGSGSGAKATLGRLVPQSPYRRAVAASAVVLLLNKLKKKKRKRVWVKKWIERKNEEGAHAKLLRELQSEDPAVHKNFLCMSPEDYYFLLEKVTQKIEKQDTILRQAISPSERLALTLRFLASGDSYRSLMNAFRIPGSTIASIVPEVCLAIYDTLKEEYLKIPKTGEEWTQVAEEFESRWQFPNCIGALDGKHVVIKLQQLNSESLYYNYKGTNSIVLMALVDANYKFLYVDIGCNEKAADSGVFTNCSLSRALECNSVNVPKARPIDDSDEPPLPYVIVADDAFAMKSYIMKPYPLLNLPVPKRIFNYRLSRARRVVENAFGLLSARFGILRRPIEVAPTRAKQITLCICALHNFLLSRNGSAQTYAPPCMLDSDVAGDLIPGNWREEGMPVSTLHPLQNLTTNRNSPQSAKAVREQFTRYFMTEKGKLQWQFKSV